MKSKSFDQKKFQREFNKTLKTISKQLFAMSDSSYDTLTNDAKFLITKMYEEYIKRRNKKQSKSSAAYFDDVSTLHKSLMPEWMIDDVEYTCRELESHGFISAYYTLDGMIEINLTTEAISKSEKRFKDNLNAVLEYAAKVKSLIPFI